MDIHESLSALGIISNQDLQRYELKELNNTLKQIAKAQGIKIKSLTELAKEKEEKHRKVEEYRKRIIIEAEAKEMGISVEEYKKIKGTVSVFVPLSETDEHANTGAAVFFFIILPIILSIVYFVGNFLHSIGY